MTDANDTLKIAMATVEKELEGAVSSTFRPGRANFSTPSVKLAPEVMTLPQRMERIEMRLDAIEGWVQRIAKVLGVGD